MIYHNLSELNKAIKGILVIKDDNVNVVDEPTLRDKLIDDLIYTAVFSPNLETREAARWLIRRTGTSLGAFPASIQPLYEAIGRKEIAGFTVPAINLRGITYFSAQAVFNAALTENVGTFIFEIARSEIGYTDQRPSEYIVAVTAAAIKTGYRGPLFLQGDHFQVNAKKYADNPVSELEAIQYLIKEAIQNGFYNIDIDPSTIVDLSKRTIKEQQEGNYTITADMTKFIRDIEPKGITVSIGGEIGEVGKTNTTVEEFRAFMDNYLKELNRESNDIKGLSKISIQTGTSHGGVPLPDGSIATVKIDFDALEKISEVARTNYGLSGAVQHGASTLPDKVFDKFPQSGTAEIHLATGFQNIIYDSDSFPEDLRNRIYKFINEDLISEKKKDDTEEQFIYKTRKKGFGHFKKDMWEISPEVLESIKKELTDKFYFLFDKLNVFNTKDIIEKYISPIDVPLEVPVFLKE